MKDSTRFVLIAFIMSLHAYSIVHASDIGSQSLKSFFEMRKPENRGQSASHSSPPYEWIRALVDAEVSSKIDQKFTFSFDRFSPNTQRALDQMSPDSAQISQFTFLTQGGRFKVTLQDDASQKLIQTELTGRLVLYKEIPVLLRPISAGETIGESDIVLKDFPENQISGGVVDKMEDLIGTQPKSGRLLSDRPIRPHQITHEVLLRKGSVVTISYKSPQMILQAKGRAIDNGKLGSFVRVTNIDSNQMLEGLVTSPNEVTIENSQQDIQQDLD